MIRKVVLGAHYDTVKRSPGANDNASGVALVLGALLKLRAVANRTRNVLFVLFDEEEIGLIGSREFATWLLDVGSSDGSDRGGSAAAAVTVHSVHTIDQMGWDSDGDRAFELELPFKGCAELYRAAASTVAAAEGRTVQISIHETNVASTDHSSFRKKGFPAVVRKHSWT